MRSGLLAKKVGMTRVFTDAGVHVPVTALLVYACRVVGLRTKDKDGYCAAIVGWGDAKDKHVSKPERIAAIKRGIPLKKKTVEFRVDEDSLPEIGAELKPSHFAAGSMVDVAGTTIGKGFQGAMKRWGFGGKEASHGVSVAHRSLGGTGGRQDPGRVFKGKKMHGHMGNRRVTSHNLTVVSADDSRGLLLVKGAVAGPDNGWIEIRDAVKKSGKGV